MAKPIKVQRKFFLGERDMFPVPVVMELVKPDYGNYTTEGVTLYDTAGTIYLTFKQIERLAQKVVEMRMAAAEQEKKNETK